MRRAAVTLAIVLFAHGAGAQTAGYKIARRPRMGLVVTGAAMLGLGWAASILSAALESFRGAYPALLVPLGGPWVTFGADVGSAQPNVLADVGLVALGLTQVTGAALLAVGLVPHEVRTRVTVSPTFGWFHGPYAGISARF